MEGAAQAEVIFLHASSTLSRYAQVPDHFEWRYLVAMDLALATTYIGETRYRQGVWGQIMDQVRALLLWQPAYNVLSMYTYTGHSLEVIYCWRNGAPAEL